MSDLTIYIVVGILILHFLVGFGYLIFKLTGKPTKRPKGDSKLN